MAARLVRGRFVVVDPGGLPASGLIEDGAVVIERGRVAEVGSYVELRTRHPNIHEIGSDAHVVLPGFVNTHHHGWGLTRFQLGVLDDYLERWIPPLWAAKPLDRYLEMLFADMKNIQSGVTTHLHAAYFRDWAYCGDFEQETRAALQAHTDSGIRTAYAAQVLDRNTFVYQDDGEFLASLPKELAKTLESFVPRSRLNSGSDDFFSSVERLVQDFGDHSRIKLLLGPVNPVWCSDELLRRCREVASAISTGLHIHCQETPFQRECSKAMYRGKTSVEHLYDLGILGPDVSLGHALWLDERDMDICAETGTSLAHNPGSNLRLRNGIMPLPRMLEKGINVCIGLDGDSMNDDEDILQEMRLAHKLSMLPRGLEPAAAPSSHDILRMATVNGARATTLGDEIGSLKPGCKADVVLIDFDRVAWPYVDPGVDVIDAILYRAKAAHVDTVLIDGNVVLERGKFTRLDEGEIAGRLTELAEREPSPHVKRWQHAMRDLEAQVARFYSGWRTPEYRPCYTVNTLF
jgi:5-methylthioadenosine/S-adenosylhomocysteine deaminase